MLTPRTLREPEPEPRVSRERELGMGGMRVARYLIASLLLASASGFSLTNKPLHGARRSSACCVRRCSSSRCSADGNEEGSSEGPAGGGDKPPARDERSFGERLEALLDTQIFDPQKVGGREEPAFLRNFKSLVNEDYQMAETLFAGLYFALLLFFSQQGVRLYKHCYFAPDNTCPWEVTSSLDSLLDVL